MSNIYTDLNDLPAFNWFRAIKTNDLKWLLIDRAKDEKNELLETTFRKLNAQLIDELGISEDYLNYLFKLRAANLAKCKWLITTNNFDFTMMEIAKSELKIAESKFSTDSKGNSDKINAERILGFRIDLKLTSVIEFYEYLNEADKLARSMKGNN